MKSKFAIATAFAAALTLTACDTGAGGGGTRDSIRAVGSSTVFPFAKKVAEGFVRSNPTYKSPLIESTGTGGGIQLFCSGQGPDTPDMANASRRWSVRSSCPASRGASSPRPAESPRCTPCRTIC